MGWGGSRSFLPKKRTFDYPYVRSFRLHAIRITFQVLGDGQSLNIWK